MVKTFLTALVMFVLIRASHCVAEEIPLERMREVYEEVKTPHKYGIVYHYYCAVGSQGRVIALATSRDVRAPDTDGMNIELSRGSGILPRHGQTPLSKGLPRNIFQHTSG